MKVAVVRQFGRPLVIEDWPIPEPGPGQISVRMEASGLCHTDIHAGHGDIYGDRHLSEVNEAIDEVLQGRATARLALRP